MSAAAVVLWIALVAFVAVLVLAGLQAARAVREVSRIKRRVDTYAELPLVAALQRAGQDAERLQHAIADIDPLLGRAKTAVATIRQGPIPPDVTNAVVRIGIEVQNLREFSP
ncbi:MAG: hypothetical protein JWO85_1270 [Candidatus Eremiobacteraeota bacterium]|jgi:hypothetical protein|nr:hypothetical protein [Candidatus Eremiobacteraeota bacterium]